MKIIAYLSSLLVVVTFSTESFQCSADGEFLRVKDRYSIHLTRHIEDENYLEVTNSETFCVFGNSTMTKPGSRSGIEKRSFSTLPSEVITARTHEVNNQANQCETHFSIFR